MLFTDGGVDAEGVPTDTDEGLDEDPTLKPPENENPPPPASKMVGAETKIPHHEFYPPLSVWHLILQMQKTKK